MCCSLNKTNSLEHSTWYMGSTALTHHLSSSSPQGHTAGIRGTASPHPQEQKPLVVAPEARAMRNHQMHASVATWVQRGITLGSYRLWDAKIFGQSFIQFVCLQCIQCTCKWTDCSVQCHKCSSHWMPFFIIQIIPFSASSMPKHLGLHRSTCHTCTASLAPDLLPF